jgi:hypothetical protein
MVKPPDESNIGAILGLICVALALLPWIGFDLWLKRHGHEYITTEFREGLQSSGPWGLVICAIIGAILGVALFHFFYQRNI